MREDSPLGHAAHHMRKQFAARRAPELLYGAVVTGSVLAVSSLHGDPDDRVVVAALGVAIIYWLAHVYVDAVGGRFEDPDHSTGTRLVHALRNNWAVLLGSVPPIIVLLIGRLAGMDVRSAAWLALWFTLGLLMAAGGVAAYRSGSRGWALTGEVAIVGSLGLIIIVLKYTLH